VEHFSEAFWVDFVRGVVSPTTKKATQQHINAACNECMTTLQMWQSVAAIAENEMGFAPPEDIVRLVSSRFAPASHEVSRWIRLLFDSDLQPVTAGVRGSVSARQFLYETDNYYIDLRLEPRKEADRACVVGQGLNRTGKDWLLDGIAVRLQAGTVSIAETATNKFGEFQLEFDVSKDLSLSIGAQEENVIVLPLSGARVKSLESSSF
jgi:hypothetical protein